MNLDATAPGEFCEDMRCPHLFADGCPGATACPHLHRGIEIFMIDPVRDEAVFIAAVSTHH